jgi:hypothetical protein
MKIVVSWVVARYSLIQTDRRFRVFIIRASIPEHIVTLASVKTSHDILIFYSVFIVLSSHIGKKSAPGS